MDQDKVFCEFCGEEIPAERLEILPDTSTCVKCSQTQPYSEAEINGFNISADDEPDRLNVEDFEDGSDTISLPSTEAW
jgi:RNA polymerase-binding transcription factor DksA